MNFTENLLWWLITGKRGGLNRAKIIKKLHERPYNSHQLSKELNLDYKTIRHHIKILEENDIIRSSGDKYSKLHFLTDKINDHYDIFEGIWDKIQK